MKKNFDNVYNLQSALLVRILSPIFFSFLAYQFYCANGRLLLTTRLIDWNATMNSKEILEEHISHGHSWALFFFQYILLNVRVFDWIFEKKL